MELSNKYIDFLTTESTVDVLEGTTYAGKTTIGFGLKFMYAVKKSRNRFHVIAAESIGTIERNIINSTNGLLDLYEPELRYNRNGAGAISLPHLKIGNDVIYLAGYTDIAKYKKVLGGQFGAIGIDEANVAHPDFIKEVFLPRFEYCLLTGNPDAPSNPIYANVFDRARPLAGYRETIPAQILNMQANQLAVEGWNYWYFTFDDNMSLTAERREALLRSLPSDSVQYKAKILGLRTKPEGLVYDLSYVQLVNGLDPGERIVIMDISIDGGYMGSATAVTAYGISNLRNKYVLATYYFSPTAMVQKAPSQQAADVMAFYRRVVNRYKCPVDTWVIDSAEGALRTELRNTYGVITRPVRKTTKRHMIEKAFEVLYAGVRVIRTRNNVTYWMREHENYAWDPKKENEPIKENDHTCDNFQYYIVENRLKFEKWRSR